MMLDTATAGVMPRRFSQAGDVAPDDSAAVFGLLAAVARAAAAIALRPDGGIQLARAGRTGWSGASFRRTYLPPLGSANTHRRGCEMLLAHGHRLETIDRIRGPIGLFCPTRDASSLAISVLAELAQLQSSS